MNLLTRSPLVAAALVAAIVFLALWMRASRFCHPRGVALPFYGHIFVDIILIVHDFGSHKGCRYMIHGYVFVRGYVFDMIHRYVFVAAPLVGATNKSARSV